MTEYGAKIRKARNERGLTIEGLAELLEVSTTSISVWERGKRLPEETMCEIIRLKLGVEPPERGDV